MGKASPRTIILAIFLIGLLTAVVGYFVIQNNGLLQKKCENIIGDGYAMGTDAKPQVIGNTCDKPNEPAD